jgi:hypothetical protein
MVAPGGLLSTKGEEAETVMLSGPVTVSAGLLESVAMTCTVYGPAVVGVPLTTQLADSVSPGGSVPPAWMQA